MMFTTGSQILVLVAVYVIGTSAKPQEPIITPEQQYEAAQKAKYDFSAYVSDEVNDLTQHRQETRNGLNVQGSYGYSDGYLKRRVTYQADEYGFRILSDELEELPGPNVNPEGIVSVNTQYEGTGLEYRVKHYLPEALPDAEYLRPRS